ncbi:MAG: helix-turn-helix domain-containing protein [Candidatus Marinimicrobia bacterium]|nr:helix-turn-helix domain-containing protein [Candidatus Neomarinimicrobiota bacterium]
MKFYTKKEVADILRVSRKTVENYINAGKLKARKIGGSEKKAGKVLINKKDLQDFIDKS